MSGHYAGDRSCTIERAVALAGESGAHQLPRAAEVLEISRSTMLAEYGIPDDE